MTLFGTPDIFYNFMSNDQGCSGVGTRSHTFFTLSFKMTLNLFFEMAVFGCVPTPFLLALHPC